jgi:hypothetical protein
MGQEEKERKGEQFGRILGRVIWMVLVQEVKEWSLRVLVRKVATQEQEK